MKDTSTFSEKATQVLISKKSEYIFVLVYYSSECRWWVRYLGVYRAPPPPLTDWRGAAPLRAQPPDTAGKLAPWTPWTHHARWDSKVVPKVEPRSAELGCMMS